MTSYDNLRLLIETRTQIAYKILDVNNFINTAKTSI